VTDPIKMSTAQDATESHLESRDMDLDKEDQLFSVEIRQKVWTVFQLRLDSLTQQPSLEKKVMAALDVAAVFSMLSRCLAKTGHITRSAFLASLANDLWTVFLLVMALTMRSTVVDVMESHLVPRDMVLLVDQGSSSVETLRRV